MDATTTKKTHATVAGESRFSSASASPSPSFSVFPSRAARARFVLALSPWRLRMIADPVIPPFLTRSAAARFASSSRRACSLTADLALSDCALGGGERECGERVRDAWRQAGGVIEAGGEGRPSKLAVVALPRCGVEQLATRTLCAPGAELAQHGVYALSSLGKPATRVLRAAPSLLAA